MTTALKRANNRNRDLMEAAAKLFAEKGFRETTMRDIAKASGMLPGSIYYHYPSKDALLLAIYEEGVTGFCDRFDEVTSADEDAWALLTRAVEAHIGSITEKNDISRIINRVMPEHLPAHSQTLRALRDQYDRRFKSLIERLDLPRDTDPDLLRLMILGASNWAQFWYRPGGTAPDEIARQFVDMIRNPISTQTPKKKKGQKR